MRLINKLIVTESGELVCASRVVLPEKEYLLNNKVENAEDGKQDEEENNEENKDLKIEVQRFDLNLDFENLTQFNEETECY